MFAVTKNASVAVRSLNCSHTSIAVSGYKLTLKRGFAAPKKKKASVGDEVVSDSIPADQKKKLKGWFEQIVASGSKPIQDTRSAEQKEQDTAFLTAVRQNKSAYDYKLRQFEERKIRIKIAAVDALPEQLKKAALREDPAPWPLSLITPADFPASKEILYAHWQIPLAKSQKLASLSKGKKN